MTFSTSAVRRRLGAFCRSRRWSRRRGPRRASGRAPARSSSGRTRIVVGSERDGGRELASGRPRTSPCATSARSVLGDAPGRRRVRRRSAGHLHGLERSRLEALGDLGQRLEGGAQFLDLVEDVGVARCAASASASLAISVAGFIERDVAARLDRGDGDGALAADARDDRRSRPAARPKAASARRRR